MVEWLENYNDVIWNDIFQPIQQKMSERVFCIPAGTMTEAISHGATYLVRTVQNWNVRESQLIEYRLHYYSIKFEHGPYNAMVFEKDVLIQVGIIKV